MSARLHCALSCPLHSREGIQPPRLRLVTIRLVLASATPVRVHEREKALRLSITLCSREAEQPTRLRLVHGFATPVRVHERESALRFSITLHSRDATFLTRPSNDKLGVTKNGLSPLDLPPGLIRTVLSSREPHCADDFACLAPFPAAENVLSVCKSSVRYL